MRYRGSTLPATGGSISLLDPISDAPGGEDRWKRKLAAGTEQLALGTKKLAAYSPHQPLFVQKKRKSSWTLEQMLMVALVASFAGAAVVGAYFDWNEKHQDHIHNHHHHTTMHNHHRAHQLYGYPYGHNNGTIAVEQQEEDDQYTLWSWLFGGPDSSQTHRGRKKHHRRHDDHDHEHHHHHHRPRRYVSNTARTRQQPIYPLSSYGDTQKIVPAIAFWDSSHQRQAPPKSKTKQTATGTTKSKQGKEKATKTKTASVTLERPAEEKKTTKASTRHTQMER